MIEIALIVPSLALRTGFVTLLNTPEGQQVVAEAATLSDLDETYFDVLVLTQAGFDLTELLPFFQLFEDPPAILCLCKAPDYELIVACQSLPVRAWGLLPQDADEANLNAAIEAVHLGLVVAPPEYLVSAIIDLDTPSELPDAEILTPREMEVLDLLADGLANKQIAYDLEISDHTVKFHVASIYTKLNVTNRAEAVRTAARLGLIVL